MVFSHHFCANGWNDWRYQWIGYANWNYSRVFNITLDQIEGKTVRLKCDGLDTVATVRYIFLHFRKCGHGDHISNEAWHVSSYPQHQQQDSRKSQQHAQAVSL